MQNQTPMGKNSQQNTSQSSEQSASPQTSNAPTSSDLQPLENESTLQKRNRNCPFCY